MSGPREEKLLECGDQCASVGAMMGACLGHLVRSMPSAQHMPAQLLILQSGGWDQA